MTNGGPLNVWETWPLYDSVLISGQEDVKGVPGWVDTYSALGALREIPFFTIRNRTNASEQYCNLDAKEILPFAYNVYSLGVEFCSPVMGQRVGTDPFSASVCGSALFAVELPKHAAIQFKVKQDERLVNTVLLTPAGVGIEGGSTGIPDGLTNSYGHFHDLINGENEIKNRWKFAEPIRIPRNSNIEAQIIFSNYARGVLRAMDGPGFSVSNEFDGQLFFACALIRVSLFGKREVQRRGEYHY